MSLTGHHLSAVVWLAIDPLERVRRCTPRPAACCMLPPRCCPDACCVHHLHATTALLPRCMLRASCCPRAAACCPSPRRVLQQRFAHPAPDLSTTLHAPDFQLLTLHARHAQAKRYADAVRLLRAVRAPGPCSARAARVSGDDVASFVPLRAAGRCTVGPRGGAGAGRGGAGLRLRVLRQHVCRDEPLERAHVREGRARGDVAPPVAAAVVV